MVRVPSRGSDQFIARFPDGLRDEIKQTAAANGRSMNAEVVARLMQPEAMSLRDWFAGQALAGFLAGDGVVNRSADDTAQWAYVYADAMLRAPAALDEAIARAQAAEHRQGGGQP